MSDWGHAELFNSISCHSLPPFAQHLAYCAPAPLDFWPFLQLLCLSLPPTAPLPELLSLHVVTGLTGLHHSSLISSSATSWEPSTFYASFIPSIGFIFLTSFIFSLALVTIWCCISQLCTPLIVCSPIRLGILWGHVAREHVLISTEYGPSQMLNIWWMN